MEAALRNEVEGFESVDVVGLRYLHMLQCVFHPSVIILIYCSHKWTHILVAVLYVIGDIIFTFLLPFILLIQLCFLMLYFNPTHLVPFYYQPCSDRRDRYSF